MPQFEFLSISKHFGAVEALTSIDFAIDAGEVVGLIGDNGAGKSTLVRVIAGNFSPSSGTIRINGEAQHFTNPQQARAQGIEVVYQDLALCNNLSAAENVFLGRELTRSFGPLRVIDRAAMTVCARNIFAELQSDTSPELPVQRMSGGQRQAVAIGRALQADAKLILLDEPTAAISVRQVHEVLALIHRLRAQGKAVVLISHRMPDIFEVCTRVVVLRRGRKVADKAIAATNGEELTGLITGAIDAA
jgi:simple sugar transport system ATP-binding protein